MRATLSRVGLVALLVLTGIIGLGAACNGHRGSTPSNPASSATPSLRIYYLVDLDGYLEPCGCQARPLGGIDRLARYVESQRALAPNSILVATGSLLYRDPTMDPRMDFQESTKADALVHILDQLGLVAFAPGPADYARGSSAWQHSVSLGHAAAVSANVMGARSFVVRDVAGTRIGIVGVSDFRETADANPPMGAPATSDPVAAARTAVEQARQQGARIVVVLASVPRRVARAIAGGVPGVDVVIAAREASNTPPPPEQIGSAFLVTATNQGKSVGVIDLYLRGGAGLVNASAASVEAERSRLDARIHDLTARVASWQADPSVDRAAVEQQRVRLAQMQRDRAALAAPHPPAHESYFNARVQEVAPEMPKRRDVAQLIAAYFHAVNEHNREAYANVHSPPPVPGQAAFVGMEQCRDCHAEAFDIWERTPHARAYHTLEVIDKQFNLSCVSCHVTGYQQPGGAEVVQNEGLRDVTCESCHGPGSLHIAAHSPAQLRATIRRQVPGSWCASQCHTPEHSDQFDYDRYRPRTLGPGHGYAVGSDGGGVTLSMPVLVGTATPPHGESADELDAGVDAAR